MAINWRRTSLFSVGLALGVAAGVLGAVMYRDAGVLDVASSARKVGGPPAVAAPDPQAAANAESQCEGAPLLARTGKDDGQVQLQPRPASGSDTEVASLILSGKEAAAAGRQHDAEIAFLNACRNAALIGNDPVPLADAEYQLARHYANVAAFGSPRAKELFERAERLYSASYLTYAARLGPGQEKTRFAQEGLKTVQQVTGGYGPVAPVAKAPAPRPAAPAQAATPQPAASAAPDTTALHDALRPPPAQAAAHPPAANSSAGAPEPPAQRQAAVTPKPAPEPPAQRQAAVTPKPAPEPPAQQEAAVTPKPAPEPSAQQQAAVTPKSEPEPAPRNARRTNPSFDCARARSATEKLICADEDLARQDRELGRLHQRARQAAADPRAFQRASDAEWERREQTCHDRECLQRWYAQRRAELSAAAAPEASAPAPVARRRPPAAPPPDRAEPADTAAVPPAPVARTPPPRRVPETTEAPVVRAPLAPRQDVPTVEVVPAAPRAPSAETLGGAPATASGEPPGTASGSPNADSAGQ